MDALDCRMEFGNSALTWRGLTVFSHAVGGEEAQKCVSFAIDVAAPNFSFSGRAACRLERCASARNSCARATNFAI